MPAIAGAAGLLVALYWLFAAPTYLADEGWFAQVAARVAGGERLYRDVWFGATPLSVWGVALLSKLLGPSLLPLKVFSALMFSLAAAVVALIGRFLRYSNATIAGLVAVLLVVSPPGQAGAGLGYNTASVPLMLAALLAAGLWWESRDRDAWPAALLAGAVAGISVGVKQNIGVYLLFAFLAVVAVAPSTQRRLREQPVIPTLVGFGAAGLVLVFLVWILGTSSEALAAWFGKGRYVAEAGIGFAEGFRAGGSKMGGGDLVQVARWLRLSAYLAVVAGIVAPAAALARNRRSHAWVGFLFGVAALISAYPRYDLAHVSTVAPLSVMCACFAMAEVKPGRQLPVALRVAPAAAAVVAALVLSVAVGMDAFDRRSVPGAARGTGRLNSEAAAETAAVVSALGTAPGSRVFVLSDRSGFYSLSGKLSNPLPWDYPLDLTLPPDAVVPIAMSVAKGEVDGVWVDSRLYRSSFAPEDAMRWVRAEMQEATVTPHGALYVPKK